MRTLILIALLTFTIVTGISLPTNSFSTAMDLSGFIADPEATAPSTPGVMEAGGIIEFVEDIKYAALYFYNDAFIVDPLATTLSFDYEFNLGELDEWDYLQFNVNFSEEWIVESTGSGHVEIDLTTYQGSTISIDWGLIWSWDDSAGTTAKVYNINVNTGASLTKPVPEPTSLALFSIGILYLSRLRRRS